MKKKSPITRSKTTRTKKKSRLKKLNKGTLIIIALAAFYFGYQIYLLARTVYVFRV